VLVPYYNIGKQNGEFIVKKAIPVFWRMSRL
jgi:hypothetical protein